MTPTEDGSHHLRRVDCSECASLRSRAERAEADARHVESLHLDAIGRQHELAADTVRAEDALASEREAHAKTREALAQTHRLLRAFVDDGPSHTNACIHSLDDCVCHVAEALSALRTPASPPEGAMPCCRCRPSCLAEWKKTFSPPEGSALTAKEPGPRLYSMGDINRAFNDAARAKTDVCGQMVGMPLTYLPHKGWLSAFRRALEEKGRGA